MTGTIVYLVISLLLHLSTFVAFVNHLRAGGYPRLEIRTAGFDAVVVVLSLVFIIWLVVLLV